MKKLLYILLLSTFAINAQDIHFSQFSNGVTNLNPAESGLFDGEFRVGTLYRNQWNSVSIPFISSNIFADLKLLEGKSEDHFYGGGISILTDQTGSGSLSTTTIGLTFAYHKLLDPDGASILSFGSNLGFFQKSIDFGSLSFENEFNYVSGSFSGPFSGENLSNSSYIEPNIDLSVLYSATEKEYNYSVGLVASHINRPNDSFFNTDNKLATKWTLHGKGRYNISSRLYVLPSAVVYYQNKATQFNIGSSINYGMGKRFKENIVIRGGIWGRMGDAVNILFGFNHNNWQFDFSYDINVSNLTAASNYQGAFEVSIIYIHNLLNIQKKKQKTVPCNRLF